jgi:chromate reductase
MITLIAGTNRPGSQTLRVAKLFESMFQKQGVPTQLLDLSKLPPELFNPAAYAQKPAAFEPFNKAVLESQGLVVFTPEYNGSFPGVLKYFIDMLTFPQAFEKRPVAFVGLAAGMWGGLRSVEQLEMIFRYRNAFTFNERVFLPRIESQLDDKNQFKDPLVKQLSESLVQNFIQFCSRVKP